MLRVLLGLLLAGVGALTFAGFFAPVIPEFEFANHVRPAILAGSGAVLLLSLAFGRRFLTASLALFAVNAFLFVLPLSAMAPHAAASGGRDLKLITFNIFYPNRSIDGIAAFLQSESADIVLFQELSARNAKAIATRLSGLYPHVHSCAREVACSQAILSKRPFLEAGHVPRQNGDPEMVWARFDDGAGGAFRVQGVHVAWPFMPKTQVRDIEKLIPFANAVSEPMILAGDLNLTPWSYKLQRLVWLTRLRLNAVLLASWTMQPILASKEIIPAKGWFPPTFLIDHVLTTPGFERVSVTIGPNLGSDHRPVIARLRLSR